MVPFIDSDELGRVLPMSAAIDALESAFGRPLPIAPARSHLGVGAGDLLLMPAWDATNAGVKLVTVAPSNPDRGLPLIHGVYVLFEAHTLRPVATLDGSALTAIRTAAVSGVATRHLARPDSSHLVVFGAGTQARAHLEAMRTVRQIEAVTIVSRTRGRAEALAEPHDARVGEPEAVRDADLICTCTTSSSPVFDGEQVAPGAHVNAVGGYRPEARELDDRVIARATVVVETKSAAKEAGDIAIPIDDGTLEEDDLVELSEVVTGRCARASDDEITVFKSVGVAFEDLVVARAAWERRS